ncbi:MAG: hypothetical protein A2X34_02600 [Elusimicrobia bacterium GWC2_51_8]|nr:MAG: hypothetical protein A2X33_06855 [Elusimicrobia bacterium GWA2_51_34]OGR61347.1 MAG: hypothetical protein A2X34_02600 [Elusimicrobia bacterium GWC2_51_8]OGR88590.1 MAG: hypothetical protein A2021_09980 [Elusimicrobia bacterium GWF2_52_66]HAF95446.1 hypothetical protein [Elusimicrobiota bacterium]HCE98108.1 hypothetical protein [Elusimicrobiota bacterium]
MNENKKNPVFTKNIDRDMFRMAAGKGSFFNKDGKYDAAVWLDFANQFNEFMCHARKPFIPITGNNFKL